MKPICLVKNAIPVDKKNPKHNVNDLRDNKPNLVDLRQSDFFLTDQRHLSPKQSFYARYIFIHSATVRGVSLSSVFDFEKVAGYNYSRVASLGAYLPREVRAIESYIKSMYPEFVTQLERQCGTLHACGPAAIALAWILSLKTGLPIGLNLPGDHIEVLVHIYVSPDVAKESEEQTSIKLCLGGREYFIDPTYSLLMEDRREVVFQEVISFEQELQDRYSLYKVETVEEGIFKAPALKAKISKEMCIVGEAIANTPLALHKYSGVQVEDREIYFDFADSICRLIRYFVPDWNDSVLSQFGEYNRMHPEEDGLTLHGRLLPDLACRDRIANQSLPDQLIDNPQIVVYDHLVIEHWLR